MCCVILYMPENIMEPSEHITVKYEGLQEAGKQHVNNSSIVVDLDSGEESCVTLEKPKSQAPQSEIKVKTEVKKTKTRKRKVPTSFVKSEALRKKKIIGPNTWRPKNPRRRKVGNDPPIKTSILGFEVVYKQCGSLIFFEVDSLLKMSDKLLPLRTSFDTLKDLATDLMKMRKQRVAGSQEDWRDSFMSWKAFQFLLEKPIIDKGLTDLLRTYSHDHDETKHGEQDVIKIADVTIPFHVKNGVIYLELLPSFSILGKLQLALKDDWALVDKVLSDQGLTPKEVFRHPKNNYR